MKFKLVLSIILFCSTVLFAQKKDSLGLYNIALLNHQESSFFKNYFENSNLSFDFLQRRFAYFDLDGIVKDKQSFFKWSKQQDLRKTAVEIIILDEREQRDQGRFDAIIVIGLKRALTTEIRQKLLKKLQTSKACSLC